MNYFSEFEKAPREIDLARFVLRPSSFFCNIHSKSSHLLSFKRSDSLFQTLSSFFFHSIRQKRISAEIRESVAKCASTFGSVILHPHPTLHYFSTFNKIPTSLSPHIPKLECLQVFHSQFQNTIYQIPQTQFNIHNFSLTLQVAQFLQQLPRLNSLIFPESRVF